MTANRTLWRRDVIGWSLYDFANTIYSMNVISLYLKRYIVEDLHRPDRYFDVPYAISMLAAAALLPALGAMSDHAAKKRLFLFLFTVTCCIGVAGITLVPPEAVLLVALLLVISNFSYEAGQPFYNALLYSVSSGKEARLLSGVGVALGYVGSILGLLLVVPFVTGQVLGVRVPFLTGGGKIASFVPTAALFFLFALPLFLWVRERPLSALRRPSLIDAYRDVWQSLRDTKKYPGVLRFLVADYFIEDAVATVIINIGLYCSLVIGFAEGQLSTFLIVSTVSAVVGSVLIGRLAQHWPLKTLMSAIVVGWALSLATFVVVEERAVIWVMGSVIGVLLGGLWTVSRPLLAELVPEHELGRFFGLFSLSGRAAAVVGPLIWTGIVLLFAPGSRAGDTLGRWLILQPENLPKLPYKLALLSLTALMLTGLVIFRKVPHSRGDRP